MPSQKQRRRMGLDVRRRLKRVRKSLSHDWSASVPAWKRHGSGVKDLRLEADFSELSDATLALQSNSFRLLNDNFLIRFYVIQCLLDPA